MRQTFDIANFRLPIANLPELLDTNRKSAIANRQSPDLEHKRSGHPVVPIIQ